MRAIVLSFNMLVKHILRDGMLSFLWIASIVVVLLVDCVLPLWIVPILPVDITPYYLLLDLFVAILIPYLFCFASSMAILEEMDDTVTLYLLVTPLGRTGYLVSRQIIPAIASAVITFVVMMVGSLTGVSVMEALLLSVFMASLAVISSMLVVVIAKNKVEGMAVSKMSGLLMIGIFIPFMLHDNVQYLFSLLPSFWIAKFALTKEALYIVPIVVTIAGWMVLLFKKYSFK